MTTLSHTQVSHNPHGRDVDIDVDIDSGAHVDRAREAGLPANPLFTVAPWWGRPPVRPGIPYLTVLLGALVAVPLLLLFYNVVSESVVRGERLRADMAVHSAATYDCKSLVALGSGEACLRLLNAPANAGVAKASSLASIGAR